jgi:hypothetical protein
MLGGTIYYQDNEQTFIGQFSMKTQLRNGGNKVTQKKYNYVTIRITEYYDAIKNGTTTSHRNRFWVVSIIDSIGNKTSRRVDSNREYIEFIKGNTKLITDKNRKMLNNKRAKKCLQKEKH